MISRLPLFPPASEVNDRDHLVVGGCDVIELATEFGTPLEIIQMFGGKDGYLEALRQLETALYSEAA